jgi:dihydroorotase
LVKNMDIVEGRFFISGRFEECCVGIEDGRIVKIAKLLEGDSRRRFGSSAILPGAIDAHVHFRDPGMTAKEDFSTGSTAALYGGVTCVLDMPNTSPPTTTLSALREKRKNASAKSMVDFGLYAGVRKDIDVGALAKEAVAFKLYMASTTGELMVQSLAEIGSELSVIADAEDEKIRKKEPEKNLDDHLRNRSNDCETSAIRKIREAAKACRLHVCHVSAKDSLPLIRNAKGLTSEVTPHHLLLDKDIKVGSHAKVNPPLRKREDRHALFKALQSGTFDIIASDHAPHTLDEKAEDFDYAPSGMPGVETMVPLMLHLVEEKHLDLAGAVDRLCSRPGEIFGIPKGRIAVGYDADFMVVDFSQCAMVRTDRLHSKCGWTSYEGMPAIFPRSVIVRGETILDRGDIVGDQIGRDVIAARK